MTKIQQPPPADNPKIDLTDLRAISVQQPYAWLLVEGIKPVENRVRNAWGSQAGRWLALHASQELGRDRREARMSATLHALHDDGCVTFEEVQALLARLAEPESYGHILALVGLDRVIEAGDGDPLNDSAWRTEDRFGLVFSHAPSVVELPRPVPCKGMLGAWRVPETAIVSIREQLEELGR